MGNEYLIFQKFTEKEVADTIGDKLRLSGIDFIIEKDKTFDEIIIGSSLDADILLKIKKRDFGKAKTVLETYFETQLSNIDKDYYLFAFTNEELKEIIQKPDEWNVLDYTLAKKILKEKGINFSTELLADINKERIEEIAKPDSLKTKDYIFGYLTAIILSPVGIFYSSIILFGKKTLPNGQRIYSYDNSSRNAAAIMFVISIIISSYMLISFLMKL